MEVLTSQHAFVACPEKAILDLVHLTPGGDHPAFLAELRLQNLHHIDPDTLLRLAAQSRKPKWQRAADGILDLRTAEGIDYHPETDNESPSEGEIL